MKIRVLTAILITAVMLPVVIFSKYMIYPIALSLFCAIAIFEVLRVIGVHNQYSIAIPSYVMGLALPFCAYFAPENNRHMYIFAISAVVILYMMYLFVLMVFRKGFLQYAKVAEIFMIVSYVVISFTSLSLIRYLEKGLYHFFLIFGSAWVTDIFALLSGMAFGKHKLAPQISPKKTVEGAIGGVIGSTVVVIIYSVLIDKFTDVDVNYVALVIFAIVLSFVGQAGDLLASVIKREHNVKDYGTLLPGHGGIMDRFDSVLAVSTVLLLGCIFVPPYV